MPLSSCHDFILARIDVVVETHQRTVMAIEIVIYVADTLFLQSPGQSDT